MTIVRPQSKLPRNKDTKYIEITTPDDLDIVKEWLDYYCQRINWAEREGHIKTVSTYHLYSLTLVEAIREYRARNRNLYLDLS